MLGDSGGPIHQWFGDHWEQIGLVSYGTRCAEAQNPGVYTRLTFYHDWIDFNMYGIEPMTNEPSTTTTQHHDVSTTTRRHDDVSTTTRRHDDVSTTSHCGTTNMIKTNFFFGSIFYFFLRF